MINKNYTRRDFLEAVTMSVGGLYFSGCTQGKINSNEIIKEPDIDPLISPYSLEKSNLTIGFVPVNDCAPFAVAYTKGFFKKYGLNVTLNRESSWASSRDGVIFGRLDAAPLVVGAVINSHLGAEGAIPVPLCAAMTIHRHGNAITMNRAMWDYGIRPLYEYENNLDKLGVDLRGYFKTLSPYNRTIAVVLSSSAYEYLFRYLLRACGIFDHDFRMMIIPPPQMVSNMRVGSMQAYMVAEPWNTRAIKGNEGVGFTFAHGSEIWYGHPDRVLGVKEEFIIKHPKTYRSLVKAMIEACKWCDLKENREELALLISSRSFTGASDNLTRPALMGQYDYGGFDGLKRIVDKPDSTIFFELPLIAKGDTNDHSTFLWHSQALWLMTQAAACKQIRQLPVNAEKIIQQAWKTDLYREIALELDILSPVSNYKSEASSLFMDGIGFDPSDPEAYLQRIKKQIKGSL